MLTPKVRRPGHWMEIGVLFAILATAAFLRLTQLNIVPPGMTHDEAAFGAEAERILSGERPIYFALGYGHEPLYAYLVAIAFSLLGHTLIALRATSAVCGLLVVLGTYLLARRMFGVRVAWISGAWMAVAFWPLSLSRQALRAITLPMLWLPAAWCLWRGLQVSCCRSGVEADTRNSKPVTSNFSTLSFALSGLFLGASFYTYMASRLAWIVYPLFALYLLLFKRTRAILKRNWRGFLFLFAIAGLVALPLALHLRARPGSERRVDAMMEPVRELLAGKPERVLRHAWNALRVFSWVGDRFWAYNIPERPIFNWVGSALFYVGLLVALWRWRNPRYAFLLIWLAVGMSPAMVTTNEGIFLRAIVAQPPTYVLVAAGTEVVGSKLQVAGSRLKAAPLQRWMQVAWSALTIGSVVMEGTRTYRVYSVDWPNRPETRNIYNYNLVATAQYVRDERGSVSAMSTVGISALYPLYYHDPWILRYVAGRSDLEVRWFDGRGGVVYPGDGDARYVLSALTPLDPALRSGFAAQATLIERVALNARDQNPYFEVWHWHGHDALAARLDALRDASPMWVSPEVQFTQPELRRSLEDPAQFGEVMALVGYELNGRTFQPGEVVQLVTYWRALRTVQAEDDWSTFVHILDGNSQVRGGVDVLHCPPTGWLPGDVAVQVHRFSIREDAPRNQSMYLEMGVYRRTAGRLPVWIDGAAAGDRVLLPSVRIQ